MKRLLAALLVLVLTAAGCASRTSTTPPGVLNVGQISNSIAFFPLFIAEKKGYFAQEGVKLGDRPRLGTGAKVAAALKSGSIDVGAGVLTDALNLARIDDGTQLVANLVDKYYVDIIVSENWDGPPVSAPLDERIRALKGKKIGITGPGSGTEALVTYLFQRVGMRSDTDVELVNLGAKATSAIGALKAGRVDALSFFQPIAQQAEAAGAGNLYISPSRGDIPGFEKTAHGVVFTTQKLMDKKSKEIAAFQRAIARAEADIRERPEEIPGLLAEYNKATDPAAREALVPILREEVPDQIGFTREAIDTALEFHRTTGLVERLPRYEEIVPPNLRVSEKG
ncbi:ABC transporter substrate-binding protein [Actinomadura algeriensis]|uniref:ABC-type nitrate/sulfonate/bicarbonate transport system substrate-binding protein n=1 Tax=Actinomadura algeriensis TaxID=1679523 RepID=A0ABR9K4G4_9ACTN|nr:ABC transporter substrate-binding protein [Actinomadura algeriensis]MBE1537702.1 ABC-type nitrate/sulfonate/bicarbonate transport system substrate-binding protein [Actinomadura algeriensis]